MKKDFIETEYSIIDGAINYASFLAQQYYNRNEMSDRVVKSAEFINGGIAVNYESNIPDNMGNDIETMDQIIDPIDDISEETIENERAPEPEINIDTSSLLVCPKCGKHYSKKGIGPKKFDEHVAVCNGDIQE